MLKEERYQGDVWVMGQYEIVCKSDVLAVQALYITVLRIQAFLGSVVIHGSDLDPDKKSHVALLDKTRY